MRRSVVVGLLVLSLAGCASESDPQDGAGAGAGAPGDAFRPPGDSAALPRLRFAASDFNQTVAYDGEFDMTGCVPVQACPGREVRFDLTPQVPADAPVELAATVQASGPMACANANLDVEDATVQRMSRQDGTLAATLLRKATGTVSLVLSLCGLDSINPGAGALPVVAEVRTVVRADVLPPYMPVTVRLVPGDRIVAMGASAGDLDSMVVVPPGLAPVHLLGDPAFNVTADLPSGDYIVVVKGAEAMLHGPNVTLVPAPILTSTGEPRALSSGAPLSWSTPVAGVPAFAQLWIQVGDSGNGLDDPSFHIVDDVRLAILQGGAELAAYEQPSCMLPCNFTGPGGSGTTSLGTDLFPEGLVPGAIDFEAESSLAYDVTVFEVIGYIAA